MTERPSAEYVIAMKVARWHVQKARHLIIEATLGMPLCDLHDACVALAEVDQYTLTPIIRDAGGTRVDGDVSARAD